MRSPVLAIPVRVLICCVALLPAVSWAQVAPGPQNVLSLSASASVEVTMDLLSVTLSTTREAADAATVQSQLRQAVDAALTEARRAARPGQLEVRTGDFSLYPRYAPKGGISGWQGRAEVVVEGRDTQAIAQLTGRLPTLSIARVAYGLSREARERVEAEVTAQAITRFRDRAAAQTQQFGFGSYLLREVQVGAQEPPPYAAAPMRMKAAGAASDEALPVEAGKATVTSTVSGSVQMIK
ncbi:MAG TPA: SIMPL domain-containing protein [Rubrivivax sp.]